MNDLNFSYMLKLQRELREKHKDSWSPLEPKSARNSLLWMFGEIGEIIDIVKKCGEDNIMSDDSVRGAFVEEMCDVLMYYNDILLKYNISPKELAEHYTNKHNKNMLRDYVEESKSTISKYQK